MGICCGNTYKDPEVAAAATIDQLIIVMKKKRDNLGIEKAQITDHIKDPKKQVTIVDLKTDDKVSLEKRLLYLDRIGACYLEVIKKLESVPKLPLDETKEHIYNIINHYLITYDETNSYTKDLDAFKAFAAKYEKV